jgi:hypothetical protein
MNNRSYRKIKKVLFAEMDNKVQTRVHENYGINSKKEIGFKRFYITV